MPQNVQVMPEPPNVLSTKDHLYLKDALSWELTAMKIMHHAAQNCVDPEIRLWLDRAGSMHQNHYLALLKHTYPGNAARVM